MTLTYATPVADWRVALDVGVPAHVVGQVALGVEDPAAAASAVTAAITGEDKKALSSISATWRTQFDADALAQHIDLAVSDGPYVVDRIVPGQRVELVRNEKYTGDRPAAYDRIVLRSDVDPLDEVSALSTGTIDVIAPVDTADVLDALDKVDGATVRTGGRHHAPAPAAGGRRWRVRPRDAMPASRRPPPPSAPRSCSPSRATRSSTTS